MSSKCVNKLYNYIIVDLSLMLSARGFDYTLLEGVCFKLLLQPYHFNTLM